MTRGEKKAHVARLRSNAAHLRSLGMDHSARLLEKGADRFEEEHKLKKRKKVLWDR